MKAMGPVSRKAARLNSCLQVFRGFIDFFENFFWVLEKSLCRRRNDLKSRRNYDKNVERGGEQHQGSIGVQGDKGKDWG